MKTNMINTLILSSQPPESGILEKKIAKCCSRLSISSISYNDNVFPTILDIQPQLVFLELENNPVSYYTQILEISQNKKFETIMVSSNRNFIYEISKYKISGYLLKPIDTDTLISTVDHAIKRIERNSSLNKEQKKAKNNKTSVIGIPTMEGYEFLPIEEIVRCESYLKCTRIVVKGRSDVISSYNIGEFIKALGENNFYRPHQSHLINLNKVQRYLKEGTIIMQDNSSVPVSRRKRHEFLNAIPHL